MSKSVKISGPSCSKSVCVGKEMREFEGAEGRVWVEFRPVAFVPEAPVASTPRLCG